jgi:general secretion pathway protein A
MYEEYFGLTRKPFSIVPDPSYFYLSEGHREALAHLLYGIKSDGGFVLLTGEVGTGKTTVCRRLLEMMPEKTEVAFILNPKVTVGELLATICDEFGIAYPEGNTSIKVFTARINDYLLEVHARGRRAVLIIEEAQNLEPDVLEQIRLLTNLETNDYKLLQMIMIGQPELRDMLAQPRLLQLSQRITARYHLGPLTRAEIPLYVDHRLSVAGLIRGKPFPPKTLKRLFRLSGGVPRLVNVICDRALLGAYVQGKEQVDPKTLTTAASEVAGKGDYLWRRHRLYQGALAALILALCATLGAAYYMQGAARLSKTNFSSIVHENTAIRTGKGETTLDKPAGDAGGITRGGAYQALFKEWHIRFNEDDRRPVCVQAQAQGLRCLTGKGSVNHLRQMNRPVVMRLVDEKSGDFYATLISLKGDSATFAVGNETRRVGTKEIVERWSGDYLLLWQPPPDYKGDLKPGSRGPMVAWLEKQLAIAQGRTPPAGQEQVYGEETVKRVKKFQLAAGMIPDGVAGVRTIMRLSAVSGSGKPALYDGKGTD